MGFNDFFNHAINEMIDRKVSIILKNSNNIKFGDNENLCSGYFSGSDDQEDCEFCVAVGGEQYESVFVHEYCHFLQWKNKSKIWTGLKTRDENDFWEWLDKKKKMSFKRAKRISSEIRDLEEDCERRSVKMIQKWDIDIDIEEYKQKANSYIFFYTLIPETQEWYAPGNPPYMMQEIMDLMPKTWINDYSVLPDGYRELILEYCVEM